ncbi:MAG TPA: hypothetical protein VHP14_13870 [Anaerolineales bacterium]|nr:hypothetical protein [Anaerolineales bacterium]
METSFLEFQRNEWDGRAINAAAQRFQLISQPPGISSPAGRIGKDHLLQKEAQARIDG